MRLKNFMREKKIYCGDKYLEVDIYPYTFMQQENNRKGRRSKKEKISDPKQKNLNDKNSKRRLVWKINANFDKGDYHISATYTTKNLPITIEEAENEAKNYILRLSRRRKKLGLSPLKFILITEHTTGEDGEKPVKIHHHIIINGGMDRDIVESLWSRRKKKGEKEGERIGIINVDRLQPTERGLEALANYVTKYKNRKRKWTSSKNLKCPTSRNNDFKYSKRAIEKIVKELPDREFWENKYKGWKIAEGDYSVQTIYNENTGWSIYLKMYKKE